MEIYKPLNQWMKKQKGVQPSKKVNSEIHNEYLALVGHVVWVENL